MKTTSPRPACALAKTVVSRRPTGTNWPTGSLLRACRTATVRFWPNSDVRVSLASCWDGKFTHCFDRQLSKSAVRRRRIAVTILSRAVPARNGLTKQSTVACAALYYPLAVGATRSKASASTPKSAQVSSMCLNPFSTDVLTWILRSRTARTLSAGDRHLYISSGADGKDGLSKIRSTIRRCAALER